MFRQGMLYLLVFAVLIDKAFKLATDLGKVHNTCYRYRQGTQYLLQIQTRYTMPATDTGKIQYTVPANDTGKVRRMCY